jgi:hypothetical protein
MATTCGVLSVLPTLQILNQPKLALLDVALFLLKKFAVSILCFQASSSFVWFNFRILSQHSYWHAARVA